MQPGEFAPFLMAGADYFVELYRQSLLLSSVFSRMVSRPDLPISTVSYTSSFWKIIVRALPLDLTAVSTFKGRHDHHVGIDLCAGRGFGATTPGICNP
jgi:hypothetical protein